MRSKRCERAKQQDSSFEIRWDSLETLYLKKGVVKLKRLFIWNGVGMRSKGEKTLYFFLNFNYINALILMGLEWGVKVKRLFIFCLNFNCIALILIRWC